VIKARVQEGPTQNRKREETLKKLFLEAGCPADELVEQKIDKSRLPNLICTLPGKTDSTIIVGGHFDMVDIGRGVADNWSGVSLLPSLYESLSAEPRHHTFVFVCFSAEEIGLAGSEFYAKQLGKEQIAKTRAMVNLDTLGLSSTKVEVDISDKQLLNTLALIAEKMDLKVTGVNVSKVGKSDADSFAKRRIAILSIHSITQETWEILHSVRDNLRSIHLADYYDTYRLVTAFLAALDAMPN
jgi:putative aminopeptidase FrvX